MLDYLTDTLSAVDLFAPLPQRALERLVGRARVRVYQSGSYLFHDGDPADAVYAIVQGTVRVERRHPGLQDAVDVVERGPGDVAGAFGLLDGGPREESVMVVQRTVAIELQAGDIALTALQFPEAAAPLMRTLSRQGHMVRAAETLFAAGQAH